MSRRAERENKESGAKYRGLLEAAPDPMVVVNGAAEIVLHNRRAVEQFGYHRDELIGQPVTKIIPKGFAERLIADDLRSTAEALAQQIGTGIELVARRKDGTEFPIEIMLSPLESAEGILVTAAIRDISVRKAAEAHLMREVEELARSNEALFVEKERAQVTLNSIGDAVICTDTSGNITFVNLVAENLTGWLWEEAAGRPMADVFRILDATSHQTVPNPMETAAREDRTVRMASDCILIRRDGVEIPIDHAVSPIHTRDRQAIGAVIVFRDVSAARAMALRMRLADEELERSNRELQDFATIASHDLQEPLRKIQAFGDRLEERLSSVLDEETADYLRRMKDAAERMQTLISNLLEYSRITMRPEPPQPVNLGRVVSDVLSDLDERIRVTNGQVQVGPLPTLLARPVQMRELFQNLISNALKFHTEGVAPEVHVNATARGPRGRQDQVSVWEIRVSDNGIGFDERFAERIFAPFQRLNGRQAFEGTGMGLAICRKIVAQCGGTITARSQSGAGATFVITLPRTAAVVEAVGSPA